MKKLPLLLSFCLLLAANLHAQPGRDETLANSYVQNGEYDKAADLYQSLWEKSNGDLKFYQPLYRCLLNLEKIQRPGEK